MVWAILQTVGNWLKSNYNKVLAFLCKKRIAELESIIAFNDKCIVIGNAIFAIDKDTGKRGKPYCNYCWELKHLKSPLNCLDRHLESDGYYLFYQCTNCKEFFRLHFEPYGGIVQFFPEGEAEESE